jgi:glycosyltransferase involved in cell wall biosynthesis
LISNKVLFSEKNNSNNIIDILENEEVVGNSYHEPVIEVVLPAYNEAKNIRNVILDFYSEISTKIPCQLIVAEDGSDDGTNHILNSLKSEIPINVFSGLVRKGYSKGVSDALRKCSKEWVLFSDSDGQYFPSDFWSLWENRHGYDMIIGRKLRRSEGTYRMILANGFHVIVNNLFGLELHDADCGFRLIRKSLIDSMINDFKYLKYSFWAEFTIRSCLKGYKVREVPINHMSRTHGNTKIYAPSKIPLIVLKQLYGLANLYIDTR